MRRLLPDRRSRLHLRQDALGAIITAASLLTLQFLTPYFTHVPKAVLASFRSPSRNLSTPSGWASVGDEQGALRVRNLRGAHALPWCGGGLIATPPSPMLDVLKGSAVKLAAKRVSGDGVCAYAAGPMLSWVYAKVSAKKSGGGNRLQQRRHTAPAMCVQHHGVERELSWRGQRKTTGGQALQLQGEWLCTNQERFLIQRWESSTSPMVQALSCA